MSLKREERKVIVGALQQNGKDVVLNESMRSTGQI